MIKLLTRRGRAYVKLGLTNDAQKTFDNAIKVAESGLSYNKKIHQIYNERGINGANLSSKMPSILVEECVLMLMFPW